MNVSMFFRRASMQGDMLPLTSIRNTMSATPLVLVRDCGIGAAAAGAATPAETSGTPSSVLLPAPETELVSAGDETAEDVGSGLCGRGESPCSVLLIIRSAL